MRKKFSPLLMVPVLQLMVSCSGNAPGSNSDSNGLPTETAGAISGTAAVGAPMANAKVTIKGASGCEDHANANAYGIFSVQLANCLGEDEFLISAESSVAKVYSVATSEDVGAIVNVTPLTQVVAARVLESTSFDTPDFTKITSSSVTTQATAVKNMIAAIASDAAFGASDVDPLKGKFAANGSKLDKVLDVISVSPDAADATKVNVTIKGSGTTISVPASASTAPAFQAADVSKATEAASALTEVKNLLKALSACAAAENETCFVNLHDGSYKNNGNTAAEEWADIYYEGMDVSFINPVIIEMNPGKTEAWIAYTMREKEEDTGRYGTPLDIMKITRASSSDSWKLFGNQISVSMNIQPSVLDFDKNDAGTGSDGISRGLNFRVREDDIADDYAFDFKSADLGVSSAITIDKADGADYFDVGTGTKPSCGDVSGYCNGFLVISSTSGAIFPKIQIQEAGIDSSFKDLYIPSLPDVPGVDANPPVFSYLTKSFDLCADFSGTPLPSELDRLSWDLGTGYTYEGFDFSAENNGYTSWDVGTELEDWSTTHTYVSFGSNAPADLNIATADIRIETRDSLDRAHFLIYGCK